MKMNTKVLSTIFVSFLLVTNASADEASKKDEALKLLKYLRVDQQMSLTNDRMKSTAKKQLMAQNLPEDLYKKMEKIIDKQFNLISEATNWESVQGEMVLQYTNLFTEEEIKTMNKFYGSDLGQKLVDKLPDLFLKGMEIGQKKIIDKQAEIQETMKNEWIAFEASLTDEEKKLLNISSPANGI